jgi:flagellar motor switch protein FliN
MVENSKDHEPAVYNKVLEEVQHFADIPMNITVRLGKCSMTIREILQLKKNSIVELPKSAGENVDIIVNGTLTAYGEVLDMEGSAGIRLTDFHTPA